MNSKTHHMIENEFLPPNFFDNAIASP